jgi:hypothetical protein
MVMGPAGTTSTGPAQEAHALLRALGRCSRPAVPVGMKAPIHATANPRHMAAQHGPKDHCSPADGAPTGPGNSKLRRISPVPDPPAVLHSPGVEPWGQVLAQKSPWGPVLVPAPGKTSNTSHQDLKCLNSTSHVLIHTQCLTSLWGRCGQTTTPVPASAADTMPPPGAHVDWNEGGPPSRLATARRVVLETFAADTAAPTSTPVVGSRPATRVASSPANSGSWSG